MKRPPTRRRADFTLSTIARSPATRFGTLVTRDLPGAAVLGDASILHEHLPARTRLPEITHRRTGEWIMVLKGTMTAYLNGKPRRLRAGAVLAIPAGVRHRFVTERDACEAVSVFAPALRIGPGADIVARD